MVGYRDVIHQLATVMFNIYQVFSIPEWYINMVFQDIAYVSLHLSKWKFFMELKVLRF